MRAVLDLVSGEMSGAWQKKDWRKLLETYSSGEDSDEHDSLNVCSVQRRAGRVTDLLHATMPSLDPTRTGTLPMGMNDVDFIRRGLVDAIRERSQHLREFPASSDAASGSASEESNRKMASGSASAQPSASGSVPVPSVERERAESATRGSSDATDRSCEGEEGVLL